MKQLFKILIIMLTAFVASPSLASIPPGSNSQSSGEFSSMIKKVMPAVVNITVQAQLPPGRYPIPGYTPPKGKQSPIIQGPRFQSLGSGVVIDAARGYVVTNAHVLKNAKMVIVTLSDGRRLKARPIGMDPATDIAVIQIKAKHLTAIPFGNSNEVSVGDFVAAIGNPFGLHQTVTSGVVSAMNRGLGFRGPSGYEDYIQTDAPINPGNSGGALVDMKGELVGINTAIVGPISGNVGIGFAIPSFMIKAISNQLITHGKVQRGLLGVVVQSLTPNLADAFGISNIKGALVTQVKPNSPAAAAGLKAKDVIEAFNDQTVKNSAQLRSMVGLLPVGDQVKLKVHRNHKTLTLTTTIAKVKNPTQLTQAGSKFLKGVQLRDFDIFDSRVGEVKGVGVTSVGDTTHAWLGGLRRGDIIIDANGKPTANIDNLLNVAKGNNNQLLLKVMRGGGMLYIVIA